ncbi:MAG TPA: two-component regulator propeller domain-containing protein, partial [Chitinophagaceae bacterium]|nr:two-component regulator propeller domain-containing protein [Chitinophagaceae bacterium]
MRWTGILLLLAGLFIQPTFLQAQRYPFVHYTPKDGLVSARARFMYQDSKGRLYITTFSGLSVYDGARFVNYTRDHGLPDNIVNDVLEMGEDSLWIMTNVNKLNCLVRGKIKDINTADGFCPVINKMLRCSNGALYALADEGLFRLENMRFVRIPLYDENGKDISRNFTRGREADNKLFLVTDPAMAVYPAPCHLVVYDLMTGKAAISKKPPDVYDVIRSPDKDILVATNYGLKNLDRTALEQGRVALTSPPPLYAAAAGKVANYLYFDRDNNLWLATAEGICKVDRQGSIRTFSMEHGLPVNLYYSVFQDKERIMWFVNEQSGLSKLSNTQVEFYSQVQKGFVADDIHADNFSDSVWMVDPEQKKILLQYPGGQKEFFIRASHPWLFRVHPGRNGNYLTGDYEVYYYDKITGKNIIPQRVFSWRDSMQGVPMVNRPVLDKNGNLLFSNDHINVVTTNKKLISYPLGYFADQFAITPQDHLWITTRANKLFLFKLHPEDTTAYFELLREYDNAAPSPRSLCYDKNGNLWIGTRDAGIYCLAVDEKFNLMVKQRFTTRTGLSDNCILSMHADESGNVWACSPVGLDKLQSKNNKWVVENITRGSNVYQNVVEVQTTRSGTHWVLTHTDVMKITPAPAIDHTNFKATILFTEIKAGRDTIGMLRHPAISYKKNDLFFQWAVPTFVDEKQTRFSYRL